MSRGELFEYEKRDGSGDESRWLLSYADMITVLLAFFALLLSMSTIQRHRFDQLKGALQGQESSDLQKLQAELERMITDASLAGAVSTRLGDDGLEIAFTNAVLFASGEAELNAEGGQILSRTIGLLAEVDASYRAVIEGHTDDVPIKTGKFDSNWELSAGRSIRVLSALVDAGIDRNRLSVQAFADTRPAEAADGAPGELTLDQRRALNRRVVIRVY